MSATWTAFGAGNFIFDILDAIASRVETLAQVVLNVPVDDALLARLGDGVRVIHLKDFEPASDRYCFGFIDPAKAQLLEELSPLDLDFADLVHARAYVSPLARLGGGNFVGPMAVVGPMTTVGRFNFLNRGSSIGHDVVLKDFNHVGPGAVVSGRCHVGSRNFFGAGSVLRDGLTVGDGVTLGAGATALKDLIDPGTYVGTPARRLPSK